MKKRGIRFVHAQPQTYEMGRGNVTEARPIGSVAFWFAQHNEDGFDKFTELADMDR